jgi:hypothetical protein
MKWQLRKYFFHDRIVFVFLVFKDKSFFLNKGYHELFHTGLKNAVVLFILMNDFRTIKINS